jgi:hypothetical protein
MIYGRLAKKCIMSRYRAGWVLVNIGSRILMISSKNMMIFMGRFSIFGILAMGKQENLLIK